ncbi:TIGR04255 family protein [Chondromyces crocatus]|uniref:TIGR04255 family protein n=1 Tax=Chondromyces crocatus TaxID=52 RepID=A0A0K1ET91_CHOCO|nr:TIGR04255 family protein [Chondromyces crocatus]AKT44061.1 uncharacterized protein CMC5_082990 [Chondromyces crocatus]
MSSPHPHLRHAPIREALLDIRVELPPEVTVETLEELSNGILHDFPAIRPIQHIQYHLPTDGEELEARMPGTSQTLGRIHWNADQSRAVQIRVDGVTVNHVQSYEDWEALRQQAEGLWLEYSKIARPLKVVRCSLRYINKLALVAGRDLAKQLRTRPEVSPELPQTLEAYFMRLVVPFEDGRRAVITELTESPPEEGAPPHLILDIDVSTSRTFDPTSDADAIWTEFDRLREIKNDCFFSSLEKETWKAYL